MTVYVLCDTTATGSITTTQGGAPGDNLPIGSQAINLGVFCGAGSANGPTPTSQSFQVVATASSGNIAATVQVVASNDGINWIAYGSAIAISTAATPQTKSATGTAIYGYYSAYLTALTGTAAHAVVTMCA